MGEEEGSLQFRLDEMALKGRTPAGSGEFEEITKS